MDSCQHYKPQWLGLGEMICSRQQVAGHRAANQLKAGSSLILVISSIKFKRGKSLKTQPAVIRDNEQVRLNFFSYWEVSTYMRKESNCNLPQVAIWRTADSGTVAYWKPFTLILLSVESQMCSDSSRSHRGERACYLRDVLNCFCTPQLLPAQPQPC